MLGERESTLLSACCVTRRETRGVAVAPCDACGGFLVLSPGDADAVCERARYALGY